MPPTPYESAQLLLKLYELRREPTMREARNWFAREFNPSNFDDVLKAVMGPDSGHLRMVVSYWDMAAALVVNGAIDEQMFNDVNGEHLGVYAKMEPFLGDYRERMKNPTYLGHLEKIVLRRPGAQEVLANVRDWFQARAAK